MMDGDFTGHFALSGTRAAPSSARSPFSGFVHHRSTGRTLDLRKGLDLLCHDTFVIICSGEGLKKGLTLHTPAARAAKRHVTNEYAVKSLVIVQVLGTL